MKTHTFPIWDPNRGRVVIIKSRRQVWLDRLYSFERALPWILGIIAAAAIVWEIVKWIGRTN